MFFGYGFRPNAGRRITGFDTGIVTVTEGRDSGKYVASPPHTAVAPRPSMGDEMVNVGDPSICSGQVDPHAADSFGNSHFGFFTFEFGLGGFVSGGLGEGKDVGVALRDGDCVFEMGGWLSVGGNCCPAVFQNCNLRRSSIHHRLYCQSHSRF